MSQRTTEGRIGDKRHRESIGQEYGGPQERSQADEGAPLPRNTYTGVHSITTGQCSMLVRKYAS